MSEGLGVQDEQGIVQYVNNRLCEMLGYSWKEMVGRQITDFIGESNLPRWMEIMRARREGRAEAYEGEIPHRDGSNVYLHISPQIIRDEEGRYSGSFGVFTDLTERKQMEERLRELHQAVEQSPNSIIITNCDGAIEYTNPAFTQVSGYSAEEVVGKLPDILKLDKTPAVVYRDLWQTIKSGRIWRGDIKNRRKDGTLYLDHTVISPIKDDKGRITHYLAIQTDITERRHAEEQARMRQADLAHVARLSTLGEMASGLAHELNQPLTAISGYSMAGLEMLQNDNQNIEQITYAMEQCNEQAQRAGEIIRRMRRLVRKEEAQKELADINSLVLEVLALTKPELRKQAIALQLELNDSLPMVYVDSIQIEQVLLNLVRNAIDAMASQGALTISTCIKEGGEWIQITVQDSGSGLDAEAMSHLFDPFYTTKAAGLGMGLSISRSIIESHGGRLWAESGTPGGALFHFSLPLDRELPNYEI